VDEHFNMSLKASVVKNRDEFTKTQRELSVNIFFKIKL
jgi:hypothetical protein